jgi:hypothetical protein
MASETLYQSRNFLVPAFGACYTYPLVLPGANGYAIDFNQVLIDSQPFYPQSVTLDCTDVPAGVNVEFRVAQINFTRIIRGGDTVTFMFPSIANLNISITPDDALSTVRAFFYNYPALTDFYGTQPVTGAEATSVTVLNTELPVNQLSANDFLGVTVADTGALGGQTIIAAPGLGLALEIHALTLSYANETLTAPTIFNVGNLASMALASAGSGQVSVSFPRPVVLAVNTALSSAVSAASTQSVGAGIATGVVYRVVAP